MSRTSYQFAESALERAVATEDPEQASLLVELAQVQAILEVSIQIGRLADAVNSLRNQ